MRKAKTLLEKLLERRSKAVPSERLTPQTIQEGEVLVEWVRGKVDTTEAASALGCSHTSAVSQKAGSLLRTLASEGYITIAWNPHSVPEEEPDVDVSD